MPRLETLQELVSSLEERGDRPCIIVPGGDQLETWTCRELLARARALAGGLMRAGLAPGTPVVLCAPNSPEWVISCCALFLANALPVPLDAQMADEDLRYVLGDSQAKWVITTQRVGERIRQFEIDSDIATVLLDVSDEHPEAWRRYRQDGEPGRVPARPEEHAVLFYTSGTTGRPKGVPLTHRNLLSNLVSLLELDVVAEDDRMLVPLPLHHIYPFSIGMLLPLASGLPIGLPGRITGPAIASGLRQAEATVIIAVPGLYQALFDAVEQRIRQRNPLLLPAFRLVLRLSVLIRRSLGLRIGGRVFAGVRRQVAPHLRTMVSGGAALDPGLGWKLEGLGWAVGTGYGLTETSPILTLTEPGKGRLDSTGRALPGVELRIEEPKPGHEHGEILAKGPNVFSGYWRRPEATSKAFDADGYFRTGDLGMMKDGYLHLAGRASSMIVLGGGENIRPERVEEALSRGPHVKEAAVLPVDGKLAALIVPERTGSDENEAVTGSIEEDLEQHSRQLPPHHRPATYRLRRGPLPRTRLGKLRRHKLLQLYEEAGREDTEPRGKGPMRLDEMSPEDRALVREPRAAKVWQWLCDRFPDRPLAPETNLRHDLGVDSLEWVTLTLELQETAGLIIQQEVIERLQTVRDLLEAVTEEPAGAGSQEELERLFARLRDDPKELLDESQRAWLRPQGPVAAGLGSGVLTANRLVMRRLARLRVRGAEHLPDDGPVVWASNHLSLLDAPALAAALPPSLLRRTWWTGWSEIMFRNPLMRLLSRLARVVPIDPRRGAISNLALGAAILRGNGSLVWFPEAGRSPDGTLQRFHPGIGLLLHAQEVPVVPVWIEGTYAMLPPGSRIPRRGSISVTFGEVTDAKTLGEGGGGDSHQAQRIAESLRERVSRLSRQE